MNNINRSLVKSQAKQIIKNKVFMLFLISAIVLILVDGISIGINSYYSTDEFFGPSNDNSYSDNGSSQNTPDDFFKYFNGGNSDGSSDYNYGDGSSSDNPIENFGKNSNQSYSKIGGVSGPKNISIRSALTPSTIGVRSITVLSIILSPLLVSLCGLYVILIKRDPNEEFAFGKEFKNIFKVSFDATYGRKLIVFILRNLFIALWSILFLIPGIVYNYSSYFAFQIMCENPSLKPSEALKLSKKMVVGNRSELFVLDLSFIGWWILSGITFGIASIYVIPYYFTTQALYYENFKIRALQEGRISEDDFLSNEQRAQKYGYTGGNYNPNVNESRQNEYAQSSNEQSYYYNPQPNNEAEAQSNVETNAQDTASQYAYNPQSAAVPTEEEPVQNGEYPSYINDEENNQ